MTHISAAEVEQQAYDMRAAEIRYAESLTAASVPVATPRIGAHLLSALVTLSECLRPLFSWNPRRASRPEGV